MTGMEHKHKHVELLGKMLDHFIRTPSGEGDEHSSSGVSNLSGPYATADSHLRGLAGAAEGFGSASIGGLHGKVYHVTSLAGQSINSQTLDSNLSVNVELVLDLAVGIQAGLLEN